MTTTFSFQTPVLESPESGRQIRLRTTASEARVNEIRAPRVVVTKISGYQSGPGPPRVKPGKREALCPK